jgi:hypothetical protein
MVGFVFAAKHREKEMEVPTKEGRSAHKDSEGAHSVLVAMLVLVGLGVAYAANIYPAHYAAIKGGDHPGKNDSLLADGSMGW